MPLGEIETHPYIKGGEITGSTKLILGSFPVYECTDNDNEIKRQNRQKKGTTRFFYGSYRSKFWLLYKDIIDQTILLPPDPELILRSLTQRSIAISDTILSCQRHDYSSEDTKLIKRTYNITGIQTLIKNGVFKILCTSKGVLNDLEKQIIFKKKSPFGQIDNLAGCNFQDNFIKKIGGNNNIISGPIAKVFLVNNVQVKALAMPSPGSPQRRLADFGFNGQDGETYSQRYFLKAFNWLNE